MGDQLYLKAAKVLDLVLAKKGSIKSLCLGSDFKNKKSLYALTCESLKYNTVVKDIIAIAGLSNDKTLRGNLGVVLVYDFLIGGGIRCGGRLKGTISKHSTGLTAALARLKIRKKVKETEDLLPKRIKEHVNLPRYIRVNTILCSVEDALEIMIKKYTYTLKTEDDCSPMELGKRDIMQDRHLKDVLILCANADLHKNSLYLEGKIIIQDKASCMPAHALHPPAGATVIDGCAAPGNKTSHLASLMGNKGKIFAFDIDERRLGTLKTLTKTAGASCIMPVLQSFTDVDPNDPKYSKVEYVLLDPSCSGSGIVSRLDAFLDPENEAEKDSAERLASLAEFQVSAVLHAFKFPAVKRVSYSTCSIHEEENEQVVKTILEAQDEFSLRPCLENWHRRGYESILGDEAKKVVRVMPEDETNGFFVALFEKDCLPENVSQKRRKRSKGGNNKKLKSVDEA